MNGAAGSTIRVTGDSFGASIAAARVHNQQVRGVVNNQQVRGVVNNTMPACTVQGDTVDAMPWP